MSLAEALTGPLMRATDVMTECGTEPIETLGFALDRVGGRALDRLEQLEDTVGRVFPLKVQRRRTYEETLTAVFEAGLAHGRAQGPLRPQPARVRHLRSV